MSTVKTKTTQVYVDSVGYRNDYFTVGTLIVPFHRNLRDQANFVFTLPRTFNNVLEVRVLDYNVPHTNLMDLYMKGSDMTGTAPTAAYMVAPVKLAKRPQSVDSATGISGGYWNSAIRSDITVETRGVCLAAYSTSVTLYKGFEFLPLNGIVGQSGYTPWLIERSVFTDNGYVWIKTFERVRHSSQIIAVAELADGQGLGHVRLFPEAWRKYAYYSAGDIIKGTSLAGGVGKYFRALTSHYGFNLWNSTQWDVISESEAVRESQNVLLVTGGANTVSYGVNWHRPERRDTLPVIKFDENRRKSLRQLSFSFFDQFGNNLVPAMAQHYNTDHNARFIFEPHRFLLEIVEKDD